MEAIKYNILTYELGTKKISYKEKYGYKLKRLSKKIGRELALNKRKDSILDYDALIVTDIKTGICVKIKTFKDRELIWWLQSADEKLKQVIDYFFKN